MKYFSRSPSLYLLPLLVLTAILNYFPALHGDFIYDDTIRIAEPVQQGDKLVFVPNRYFTEGFSAVLENTMPDRPLLMATIWLNYYFSGGNTFSYKVTNVVLHGIAAFLLYIFLTSLFAFVSRPVHPLFVLMFALIFLAHPLHNQAVTMVIQRGVILSAIFCLIAFIAGIDFLSRARRESLWLMFFSYGLALLCKSNVLTFPLIFGLFAYQYGKPGAAKKIVPPLILISFLPAFFYLVLRENFHVESSSASSWLGYGRVQAHVIFHYLRQVFWPLGLNSTYPIPSTIGFFEKGTWFLLAVHLINIGAAGYYFFKRRSLLAFGVLAFYAALIPESSIFPIPHVVFDHRMYFPFLFLGICFLTLLRRTGRFAPRIAVTVFLYFIFGALLGLNYLRSMETNTYEKWVTSSALKYKHDHLANIHLLNMLFATGKSAEGVRYAQEFSALYPEYTEYRLFVDLFRDGADTEPRVIHALMDENFSLITTTTRVTLVDFLVKKYLRDTFYRPLEDILSSEKIFALLYSQRKRFSEPRFARFLELYSMNALAIHERYLRLYRGGFLEQYQQLLWEKVWLAITLNPRLMGRVQEKNLFPPLYVTRSFKATIDL